MGLGLPEGAQRVQDFLSEKGSNANVSLLPETTATALDAAFALGVPVKYIGKSIAFESENGIVVAVICGDQRVDVLSLAATLDTAYVKPLRAEAVRTYTGYVIGGVSPLALPSNIEILIDGDLATFTYCFVAAGHPKAVVRIEVEELIALTNARVASIAIMRTSGV